MSPKVPSPHAPQRRAAAYLLPVVLLLLGAGLFTATHSDAIQVADSGELVVAACRLGVAHPPGYPLYTVAGHLLCKLPLSTAAGRLSLLSLLAGLAALFGVYAIVVRLTANRAAAFAAGLVLATGPLFWRYASIAEVFALNVALCLGLVHAALRAAQAQDVRRHLWWLGLSALLLGLALSNHHTSLLAAPLVLLVALRPLPEARSPLGLRIVVPCAAIAVGLLPYLHLWLADPHVLPRWGATDTLQGLVHHVLRRDYGTLSLTLDGTASPLSALGAYVRALPAQLGWPLAVVAPLGLVLLISQALRHRWRAGLPLPLRPDLALGLALLPLLCGPVLLLLFNIDAAGIKRQVVERFFLLPNALLVIPLGLALAWIDLHWLASNRRRRIAWQIAIGAIIVACALISYPRADARDSYAVEDYAHNALQSAARDAVVLGDGDVRLFGILHAQELLGHRRDVHYVDVAMLGHRWYVEQQRRRNPHFDYRWRRGTIDTVTLISSLLARGRPVYLASPYSQRAVTTFIGYPEGPLLRLLPAGESLPPLEHIIARNERLYRSFKRRGRAPDPQHDPWSASLYEPLGRTWRAIAELLRQRGDHLRATAAARAARVWTPGNPGGESTR